ncbi:MAG: DUF3619 family protein [Gallionella sp.]
MKNDILDQTPDTNRPESIAKLLTRSAEALDTETTDKLRRSRNIALSKKPAHNTVLALTSGNAAHLLIPHTPQQWFATIVLLAALLVSLTSYWHHAAEPDLTYQDMSHLDLAILTDDLPMEIFLDL